ncbi:hypothetical protein L208DRAFT_1349885, partial [Tricholoma matsutake]
WCPPNPYHLVHCMRSIDRIIRYIVAYLSVLKKEIIDDIDVAHQLVILHALLTPSSFQMLNPVAFYPLALATSSKHQASQFPNVGLESKLYVLVLH